MVDMSLEQAVRNGLEIERAAEQFYRVLAESTEDADARLFLAELADQESQHAARIAELGKTLGTGDLPNLSSDDLIAVETAPEWAFSENLNYDQAIALAIENEEHAALYYDVLSDFAQGNVRDFFRQLCKDEQAHVEILRSTLQRLRKE